VAGLGLLGFGGWPWALRRPWKKYRDHWKTVAERPWAGLPITIPHKAQPSSKLQLMP
jgi:hypothetical protein